MKPETTRARWLGAKSPAQWTGCQYADSGPGQMGILSGTNSQWKRPVGRTASTTLERGTTQRLFLWMKLCWGAVEIAFDHEDGDIVAEAKVFRKIRRAAEDVFHERFRG